MKNFSTILNVVLLAAVAFLYYYVFAGKKADNTVVKTMVGTSGVSQAGNAPIAYVELDSLNERIVFIKEKRKELEAEQKAIENEWQSGMKGLEGQKDNFIKKNGNTITQQMAEEFQNKLYQQQQNIEEKKQNQTQRLTEKSYKAMDAIQKQLKDFLKEYNQDKKYLYILTSGTGLEYMVYKDSSLNITKDVIDGMNTKLKKGN